MLLSKIILNLHFCSGEFAFSGIIIWLKRIFLRLWKRFKKVNQYQLDKQENTQYILKLGYAKFMTGDSNGAIDALEEAYKMPKKR